MILVLVAVMMTVAVIVGLVRFAESLRGSIRQADGDLHRVNRTALSLLDPHRHAREAEPCGEAF